MGKRDQTGGATAGIAGHVAHPVGSKTRHVSECSPCGFACMPHYRLHASSPVVDPSSCSVVHVAIGCLHSISWVCTCRQEVASYVSLCTWAARIAGHHLRQRRTGLGRDCRQLEGGACRWVEGHVPLCWRLVWLCVCPCGAGGSVAQLLPDNSPTVHSAAYAFFSLLFSCIRTQLTPQPGWVWT
jgi:hypothetical protein